MCQFPQDRQSVKKTEPLAIECCGVDLFAAACGQDLDGIVAKLAAGRYEPEETTWVKIKNRSYSQGEGRADFFDGRGQARGS